MKTLNIVLILVLLSLLTWVSFHPPVPAVATQESSTPGRPDQAADGFSGFEYTIKERLRDPDSFKFYGATLFKAITLNHAQAWQCRVNYGAKNGFGGYNREYGFIVVTNATGNSIPRMNFILREASPDGVPTCPWCLRHHLGGQVYRAIAQFGYIRIASKRESGV